VFEFGFFVGALGRNRVAVLYEDGVELPSDVDGLLHIGWDGEGGWKLPLAKEPNAAGIDVKVERLLGLTGAGPGPLWPKPTLRRPMAHELDSSPYSM
jgi:hypothetical protein